MIKKIEIVCGFYAAKDKKKKKAPRNFAVFADLLLEILRKKNDFTYRIGEFFSAVLLAETRTGAKFMNKY